MDLRLTSLLSALVISSLACATTPPPAPQGPDSSVIGACVKVKQVIGSLNTDYAYFVRLDDPDAKPLATNYASGQYVYLFNAKPGRYALVGAGNVTEAGSQASTALGGGFGAGVGVSVKSSHNVYLPQDLIDKTTVAVGPREWAFVGEVVVERTD